MIFLRQKHNNNNNNIIRQGTNRSTGSITNTSISSANQPSQSTTTTATTNNNTNNPSSTSNSNLTAQRANSYAPITTFLHNHQPSFNLSSNSLSSSLDHSRRMSMNEKLASIGGVFGLLSIVITAILLYAIFTTKSQDKWYYIIAVLVNISLLVLLMICAILFDRFYLKKYIFSASAHSASTTNNINNSNNSNPSRASIHNLINSSADNHRAYRHSVAEGGPRRTRPSRHSNPALMHHYQQPLNQHVLNRVINVTPSLYVPIGQQQQQQQQQQRTFFDLPPTYPAVVGINNNSNNNSLHSTPKTLSFVSPSFKVATLNEINCIVEDETSLQNSSCSENNTPSICSKSGDVKSSGGLSTAASVTPLPPNYFDLYPLNDSLVSKTNVKNSLDEEVSSHEPIQTESSLNTQEE